MTPDPFKQCITEIVTFCKQVDEMVKEERLKKIEKVWQAFLVKKLIEKLGEQEQWYYLPENAWGNFN